MFHATIRWSTPLVLLFCLASVHADQNWFFADRVLSLPDHDLHIISNMPEPWVREQVIRNVTEVADNGAPKLSERLQMHPASVLGQSGPNRNLLPFDPLKKAQTVIVLDSSKLDEPGQEALRRVRAELFGQVSLSTDEEVYWIAQNGGGPSTAKKSGAEKTHQVLVVAPGEELLREVLNELWMWPGRASKKTCPNGEPCDVVRDGNGRAYAVQHHVRRVHLKTNDSALRTEAERQYHPAARQRFDDPYDLLTTYWLGDNSQATAAFAADDTAELKIVALNWNGEREVPADLASQLLPPGVVAQAQQAAADARGLTGWQQFCRTTYFEEAQRQDGRDIYLAGPSSRQLLMLLRVAQVQAGPPPPVVDLSGGRGLAVGAYLLDRQLPENRMVAQHELEQLARAALGWNENGADSGIMVVPQGNMGELLRPALGANPDAPFHSAGGPQQLGAAAGADLLLLLWAQSLSVITTAAADQQRLTPEMAAFTATEPSEPRKPDPGDKVLFGGFTYPGETRAERERSAKYQRDLAEYYEDVDDYDRDIESYKAARRKYEKERANRRVEYAFRKYEQSQVHLSGYLKLVDLRSGDTLWGQDVQLDQTGPRLDLGEERVVVSGETTVPRQPYLPGPHNAWTEPAYDAAGAALQEALRRGLMDLRLLALMPGDIKPWNK